MRRNATAPAVERTLYRLGIAAAVLAAALIFWVEHSSLGQLLVHFPCPFRALTGFYCPGCRGTRALEALCRGQVWESLRLHPLVPWGAALYLAFMASWTLWQLSGGRFPGLRWRDGYLWGALALLAVNWLVKNALLLGGWAVL